ncbi:MAG TPA: dihydrodipicolinate synthase family protein [Acetobacteraceae bacterium]|nr:dihydrodipicolinate synthase family protein [Acetobacteraceae bacterium]
MPTLPFGSAATEKKDTMQGIWLPLITPFQDGRLDEGSLVKLLHRYLAAPIDGLILAATTGEALTLDTQETERLVSLAAATAAGRLPIFLGLCGSDTRGVAHRIDTTRHWPIDGTSSPVRTTRAPRRKACAITSPPSPLAPTGRSRCTTFPTVPA